MQANNVLFASLPRTDHNNILTQSWRRRTIILFWLSDLKFQSQTASSGDLGSGIPALRCQGMHYKFVRVYYLHFSLPSVNSELVLSRLLLVQGEEECCLLGWATRNQKGRWINAPREHSVRRVAAASAGGGERVLRRRFCGDNACLSPGQRKKKKKKREPG